MRLPSLVAILVAVAAATTVVATPAAADNGPATRTTLASSVQFTSTSPFYLTSDPTALGAGDSVHVHGHLAATSSMKANANQVAEVRCLNSSNQVVGTFAASSRNHEGFDAGYPGGELALDADLLFTAPAADTYRCQLVGETGSDASGNYHQTAVAADTYLEISSLAQFGHMWQNPACSATGGDPGDHCTYLGPQADNGQRSTYVWYNDGTPAYQYPARPTATAVDAYAHVEITTCYAGTASCPSARQGTSGNSVVTTRVDVIQLDATLHTCGSPHLSSPLTSTISNDAHHYSITMSMLDVPIDPTCGSLLFILRVYTTWVSGNTVKIDGTTFSGSELQTGGILLDK